MGSTPTSGTMRKFKLTARSKKGKDTIRNKGDIWFERVLTKRTGWLFLISEDEMDFRWVKETQDPNFEIERL